MRNATSNPMVLKDRLTLRFLPALGYRGHVSVRRLADHAFGAGAFLLQSSRLPPPAALYASYPTLELATACGIIARRRDIRLCIDVRDLWPDIFSRAIPAGLRSAVALPLSAYRSAGRFALRSADAVVSVTEPMLQWALALANRPIGPLDLAVPFPHSAQQVDPASIADATRELKANGLDLSDQRARVLYCGGVTRTVDVRGIVSAADRLQQMNSDVQIVVFGAGDRYSELAAAATSRPNLYVGGWTGVPSIAAVARCSAGGLVPYRPMFDFEMSIPNKIAEYLYYGLPILTSLRVGPVVDLINQEGAGILYEFENGDSLADAICQAVRGWRTRHLANDQRLQLLGKSRFSAEATVGKLVGVMETLVNSRVPITR